MTLTPLAQMLNASGCFGTDKLGPFLLRQDDGTMQAVPALYLKTPYGGCRTAAPPEVLQAAMDLPIEEAPCIWPLARCRAWATSTGTCRAPSSRPGSQASSEARWPRGLPDTVEIPLDINCNYNYI